MDQDKFINSVNHALNHGYGPHPESSSLSNLVDSFAGTVMSARERFEVPPMVLRVVSDRMAFPLGLKHANIYASKSVVLVGDAAHTVHPLAGQGVNLGFGDASTLARVLVEGVSIGADISEVSFGPLLFFYSFLLFRKIPVLFLVTTSSNFVWTRILSFTFISADTLIIIRL